MGIAETLSRQTTALDNPHHVDFYTKTSSDRSIPITKRAGGFSMMPVKKRMDQMAMYRLRHDVYCKEYGWVDTPGDYEHDGYDAYSTHYIAKDPDGRIAGTIRTISHEFDWMAKTGFDNRFRDSAAPLVKKGVNEASRLTIGREFRNIYIYKGILLLDLMLSTLLFHHSLEDIGSTYIITFATLGKMLGRRGLHIEAVSDVNVMPDGCRIQAFVVNTRLSMANYYPYDALINCQNVVELQK